MSWDFLPKATAANKRKQLLESLTGLASRKEICNRWIQNDMLIALLQRETGCNTSIITTKDIGFALKDVILDVGCASSVTKKRWFRCSTLSKRFISSNFRTSCKWYLYSTESHSGISCLSYKQADEEFRQLKTDFGLTDDDIQNPATTTTPSVQEQKEDHTNYLGSIFNNLAIIL